MTASTVLHATASFERLGVTRIVVFFLVAWHAALTPIEHLATLPPEVFEPLGLMNLVPLPARSVLQSSGGLWVLRWGLFALSAASTLGVRGYRVWAPMCALALLLFESTLVLGAPSHRALVLLYCVFVLAFSPADVALALTSRSPTGSHVPSIAMGIMAFALLFTYSLTAFYRVSHGAPAVFVDHSMAAHLVSNAGRNGAFGFDYGQQLVDVVGPNNPVLGLMLFVGTLMEALALVCLFAPRFRRVFVVAIVGFHLVNVPLLNIEFFFNCVLAPLLLIEWEPEKFTRPDTPPPTARPRTMT